MYTRVTRSRIRVELASLTYLMVTNYLNNQFTNYTCLRTPVYWWNSHTPLA